MKPIFYPSSGQQSRARKVLLSCLLLGWTVVGATAQSSFVQENDVAFFASGSAGISVRVNLVDKASGQVRTGLVNSTTGVIAWEGSFASGVENVTGAALWRTSSGTGIDLLAVTSPLHNRIEMPPTGTTDAVGYPVTGVVGPAVLAGLEPFSSSGSHFVIGSVENGAPSPLKLSAYGVLNDVTGSVVAPDVPRAANRIRLKTGTTARGAMIFDGRLQVAFINGAGAVDFPAVFAVPEPSASRWIYGWFKNEITEPRSQILEFTPGENSFRLNQVTEPVAGSFSFAQAVSYDLGAPLEQLTALQIPGSPRLVAVFADGTARLYDFNGSAAPVLRASYSNLGGDYRFALTGGGSRLVFLTDSGWSVFDASGASPSALPLASGDLPALRPKSAAQNVFITQGEALADPAAVLVGGSQFDEWVSDPATPGGQARPLSAAVNLRTERFIGETDGLALAVASRPVEAQGAGRFVLPNQHRLDASVASFGTSAGNLRPDVFFTPPPGAYAPASGPPGDTGGDPPAAVTVRLSSSNGAAIFYRTSAGQAWTAYDPASPLALDATLTVEARSASSAIRRGTYTIAVPSLTVPEVADANLNGLADGWEQLFGQTDPNADPDGDGFNNLTEQNAGTDPLDGTSLPVGPPLSQINLTADLAPGGGSFTLTWPANIGPVILQYSTNFTDWAPVNPQPAGNSYAASLDGNRGFYRLVRP
jgi:hypothetical protein